MKNIKHFDSAIKTLLFTSLIILSVALLAPPVRAEDGQITIKPQGKMTLDLKANVITFYDKVVMRDNKLTMTCEKLSVHLKTGAAPGKSFNRNAVDRIVAHEKVTLENPDMKVSADRAVYTLADQIMVFEGKPARAEKDGNVITSTRITYNQKDDVIDIAPDGKIVIKKDGKLKIEK